MHNQKKYSSYRCILSALACVAMIFVINVRNVTAQSEKKYPTEKLAIITKNGNILCFDVEIALSDAQKSKGLMFREKLQKKEGMLFYWQQKQTISMWMKNTPISLDMFFVQNNGTIKYIAHHTKPFSLNTITAPQMNNAVLEVIAGTAKKFNINPGDKIIQRLFSEQNEKAEHICP